jgi:putative ATP-dependent endonuclease of OLD family
MTKLPVDPSALPAPAAVQKPSILVDCLRISGFRGIQNLEITFCPMTILIGPNNSGKTTVLKALGLALGDYGRYVTEEDFYIGVDNAGVESKADEIVVDVRIVPLADNGQRANAFDTSWQAEFGDKIKAEADGKQYVAVRTKVSPNVIKGGFQAERHTMEKWPDFSSWLTGYGQADAYEECLPDLKAFPFFSIEAQRDIHSELRDRNLFCGKGAVQR